MPGSSSLDDEDTPGFFLTATALPPQTENHPVLPSPQRTAQAVQRLEQELAVLRGMGYTDAFSTEASSEAADRPLDLPDMAEAIEEAQRELEAADEAREWRGLLEARAEVTEAVERHDSTAKQDRQALQDYLDVLQARVEEPGLSFSDERYSQLLAEREAHGAYSPRYSTALYPTLLPTPPTLPNQILSNLTCAQQNARIDHREAGRRCFLLIRILHLRYQVVLAISLYKILFHFTSLWW